MIKERIAEIYSLADQASEQIRELSHYLRPSMLDDLGLVPTLRWYLDVYRKKTVETHRAHIMNKLDIHSTAELTRYAIRKGIISSDTTHQVIHPHPCP